MKKKQPNTTCVFTSFFRESISKLSFFGLGLVSPGKVQWICNKTKQRQLLCSPQQPSLSGGIQHCKRSLYSHSQLYFSNVPLLLLISDHAVNKNQNQTLSPISRERGREREGPATAVNSSLHNIVPGGIKPTEGCRDMLQPLLLFANCWKIESGFLRRPLASPPT